MLRPPPPTPYSATPLQAIPCWTSLLPRKIPTGASESFKELKKKLLFLSISPEEAHIYMENSNCTTKSFQLLWEHITKRGLLYSQKFSICNLCIWSECVNSWQRSGNQKASHLITIFALSTVEKLSVQPWKIMTFTGEMDVPCLYLRSTFSFSAVLLKTSHIYQNLYLGESLQ